MKISALIGASLLFASLATFGGTESCLHKIDQLEKVVSAHGDKSYTTSNQFFNRTIFMEDLDKVVVEVHAKSLHNTDEGLETNLYINGERSAGERFTGSSSETYVFSLKQGDKIRVQLSSQNHSTSYKVEVYNLYNPEVKNSYSIQKDCVDFNWWNQTWVDMRFF